METMKLKTISKNCHELHLGQAIIVFSYETPIIIKRNENEIYVTSESYSRTTTNHIKAWLKNHNLSRPDYCVCDEGTMSMYLDIVQRESASQCNRES